VTNAAMEPVRSIESSGWLTTYEAADWLARRFSPRRWSARSVQSWCTNGYLKHAKVGGRLLIHVTDLEQFVQGRRS
jgi:hypothetical protein